jgi:hypothetical protein
VADDPGTTPAPRPRRRRTDFDPTFKPPKVAHERRRAKRIAPEPAVERPGESEPASAASVPSPDAGVPRPEVPPPDAKSPADSVSPAGAPPPDADAAGAAVAAAAITTALPFSGTQAGRGPVKAAASAVSASAARPTGEPWLPMLEDRSPNEAVCPFLRAVDADGVRPPIETPDAANRCAALRDAVPQSLRQQELVCLSSGHINCPRYLRGAVAVTELPPPVVRPGRTVTPTILASIIVLIGAFALSVGFVVSRGSLELAAAPTRSPAPSATSEAAASTVASGSVDPAPTAAPIASPTPTPAATASPTPPPTPTPSPEPSPTPKPTPKPDPTSDRYALLEPCPNADRCWIYTVRPGDNLFSIANYFGVPLARVYAMNPWLESTGLRAGQALRLPPPTR